MRKWEVDYNFVTNKYGKRICMCMQMGFETEEAAIEWAKENTVDGEIHWYERIW